MAGIQSASDPFATHANATLMGEEFAVLYAQSGQSDNAATTSQRRPETHTSSSEAAVPGENSDDNDKSADNPEQESQLRVSETGLAGGEPVVRQSVSGRDSDRSLFVGESAQSSMKQPGTNTEIPDSSRALQPMQIPAAIDTVTAVTSHGRVTPGSMAERGMVESSEKGARLAVTVGTEPAPALVAGGQAVEFARPVDSDRQQPGAAAQNGNSESVEAVLGLQKPLAGAQSLVKSGAEFLSLPVRQATGAQKEQILAETAGSATVSGQLSTRIAGTRVAALEMTDTLGAVRGDRPSPTQANTPNVVTDSSSKSPASATGIAQHELVRLSMPNPVQLQQSQLEPDGAIISEMGQTPRQLHRETGLYLPQPGLPAQAGETLKKMVGFDQRLPGSGDTPGRISLQQSQPPTAVVASSTAPDRASYRTAGDAPSLPDSPGVTLTQTAPKTVAGLGQVAMESDADPGKHLLMPRFEGIYNPGAPAAPDNTTARPETARMIAYQLAEGLSAQTGKPVEITLNREELGRVRMILNTTDTGVAVAISAERPETLDLMRRNIDLLSAELRRLGYEDVGFDFDDGNAGGSKREERSYPPDTSSGNEITEPDITRTAQAVAPGGLDLRL